MVPVKRAKHGVASLVSVGGRAHVSVSAVSYERIKEASDDHLMTMSLFVDTVINNALNEGAK